MKTNYNKQFYDSQKSESYDAARIIVPLIIYQYKPQSVIDIGCGLGTWLKVWSENGTNDYLGIDGSYVNQKDLLISKEHFRAEDLNSDFIVDKRYDLAECLEVAEHLPIERSKIFVQKLVQLSDIILFSAALPFQGGTDHLNENWLEYWAILFNNQGYVPIDFIRKKTWNNSLVPFWYRQNIIIFAKSEKKDIFKNDPILEGSLSIIHPEMLLWTTSKLIRKSRKIEIDLHYYNELTLCFSKIDKSLPDKTLNYNKVIQNKKINIITIGYHKTLKLLKKYGIGFL